MGKKETDEELEKRMKSIAINQCCQLIYTSGATGNPKGVMMSHDSVTFHARVAANYIPILDEDIVVSIN